ncbi:MAG: ATP-binding protein, partial [Acidobacteria bacterium]|nr:ATP-binding protein [Acidobacteriota bacterium]
FGQMNDEMRPALARLCREHRQTVVVLDAVLMLYLYGQRAPRLHTLFECTLPFTWTEPYTATSVPPEMFYGRIQERKSIMSPTGSGFVFGGRRLGKTALLRDVERNFHDLEKGRIAIFLDLEGENIGTQRNLDDLWMLLGEEMKRHKVVNSGYDNAVTLLDQICDWLDGNQQRRILVLLDQADRFLEADEKEQFVRASRLRGLMEKTNRRFKIVFAGVHNIPRMTRVADHPLAQFGTPISIGPLLGHEAHEARKLIEEPLNALGYVFETPDLVRRILWRTNYYPSLIQHYCNHLLKYLSNPNRQQSNNGPPYFITSEDVDEAYRSQDLRAAIRAGLLLTLQVDERYSVIAYAMADGIMHNGEEALTEGFPVSWVAAQALYWWSEGFQSVLANNALPVLLDEMVGLGILRVTEKGYTLRSKGVAVLLGNEDQIAAELQRVRKTPQKYNPTTFRAARTGSPRRSPLTAQEMLELRSRKNGISLIFGTDAAGLDTLREFAEVATPRGLFVSVENEKQSGFSKQLNEALARQQNGTTLLYVPPSCVWDEHWIEEAHQTLDHHSAQSTYVRVAFIADPARAWQLVSQQSRPFDLLPGKNVTPYSLKPWHDDALRQWLDDRDFNIDEAGRERISAVTGNWPMLLEYFYQRSQVDSFHWMEHLRATAKDLKDKHVAQDLARMLGLTQAALQSDELIAKRILLALETNGEQTVEELYRRLNQTTNEFPEGTIKRVLWWAELLSLAYRVGPRWRVDHLVGRILKAVADKTDN